jgi:hypothetical protein
MSEAPAGDCGGFESDQAFLVSQKIAAISSILASN